VGFLQNRRLHILILILIGLIVYSNTLKVPFQLDDRLFVEQRQSDLEIKRDIKNLAPLTMFDEDESSANPTDYRGPWASRPLLYITLVMNHVVGGYNTWGYHLVNIFFHLINGILLYFLIILTGRHLGLEQRETVLVALLASSIFVLHPVETEAVTNIINRSILMATTFYIAGLLLFLKAATSIGKRKRLYILLLLLAAFFGASAREDFATFFLMLFVFDLLFISRFRLRDLTGHYMEYLACIPGLALMIYLIITNTYETAAYAANFNLPAFLSASPIQYVLTEFSVQWTYVRLLILPINQNLNYGYPISQSLTEVHTLIAALAYGGLWAGSLYIVRKRPVVSFGILWFLVILLPVSFAIAFMKLRLGDVIFEHRLYLPSIGLIVLSAAVLVRTAKNNKVLISIITVICLVLGSATYARNNVWTNPVNLWHDVVKKSPNNPLAHNNYGVYLYKAKRASKAIEEFEAALRLWPSFPQCNANLGAIYLSRNDADKAIEYYDAAVKFMPDMWYAHIGLGFAYSQKKEYKEALKHQLIAVKLVQQKTEPLNSAADSYYKLGQLDEAIKYYSTSLWLDRNQPRVLNNMAIIFIKTGQKERAIKHLEPLIGILPTAISPRIKLGMLYLEIGRPFEAVKTLKRAVELKPDNPEVHRAFANAVEAMGDKESAEEERRIANQLEASGE